METMPTLTLLCNLFYGPTDEAKSLYATYTPKLTLINGGSTLKSDDWAQRHCIFDDCYPNNISHLNSKVGEVTALHYLRNNLPETDYVGHCHYRLFFSNIPDKLDADIYVAKPIPIVIAKSLAFCMDSFTLADIRESYYICHVGADFDRLIKVIDDRDAKEWTKLKGLLAPCQMFVMRKELFINYFDWMWPKLQKLMTQIDLSGRDNYQKRAFMFLAERLLSFWTFKQHIAGKKIVYLDTVKYDAFKPSTATDNRGQY